MPEEARPAIATVEGRTLTDDDLRLRAVDLLEEVWLSIDHRNMQPSRRMGLWDELVGRVRSASHAPTLTRFFEALARKLGVMSIRPLVAGALTSLSRGDADAMLRLYRTEPLVSVCELRARRDAAKVERELKLKQRRK